jgi:phage repressor protein C with HTH and peptisase S24 domain
MTQAERLRQAREEAGYVSAAAAAREFGWNEGSYRHHENGTRGFDAEQASVYAMSYEVSAPWLLGIAEDKSQTQTEMLRSLVHVFETPLGEIREIEDKLIEEYDSIFLHVVDFDLLVQQHANIYLSCREYIAFSRRIADQLGKAGYKQIVAVFADSSEMEPTIKSGDLFLVDTAQKEPNHHDQIWLMSKAGKVLIRRLRFVDQYSGTATADSPSVLPVPVDLLEANFVIHGRVVWIGKQV